MSLRPIFLSALLTAALLGWRLFVLYGFDPAQAGVERVSEAQQLFEAMQAEGLLTLDKQGRVSPAPADEVLALRWAKEAANGPGMPLAPADEALVKRAAGVAGEGLGRWERLLQTYYHSPAGDVLAEWLRQWNRGRVLSGVRDDRPSPHPNPEGGGDAGWTAWNRWNEPLGTHARLPLEFGYLLNGELRPGFGDWTLAPGEAVTYRTQVRLAAPASLHLQLVGRPDLSSLPDATVLGCLRDPGRGQPHCAKPQPGVSYDAWQIRLPLAAGNHALALKAEPVRNPAPEDRDLPLVLEKGRLVWRPLREHYGEVAGVGRPTARFVLETADGEALTEETGSGRPTPFTLKHGLSGLVGFGPEYRGTLAGLLARSSISDKGRVALTLDGRLQAIAQAELERKLKDLADPRDPDARERRAAVVLLDPRSGAILAAAGHPQPPSGTHRWDRAAFEVIWPNLDPFRFTPWQGLDNHSAPGSTFKPVTALAAMAAIEQGKDADGVLAGMLEGWSPRGVCPPYRDSDGRCLLPAEGGIEGGVQFRQGAAFQLGRSRLLFTRCRL
ncbi:MAG: hypothetical protein KJ558_04185 [Gammaproteobacteria bacterium]|nr:hypothetical protein [Gammaproteobacteria bacterium]MBU1654022.1 hypothetical protein [Gammaproteobacteria bacterium]MBU1959691.1 hypothetical protein [Gammaproteobacteria bacterium]